MPDTPSPSTAKAELVSAAVRAPTRVTVRAHTEADMISLLRAKYTRVRAGTAADRYVRAAHIGYPDAYGYPTRIADYMVIDTYRPQHIIGFEIKVSRSDWLHELAHPEKSAVWRKHCHRWYLVVPDMSIVGDDLPDGWGLMAIGKGGALVQKRRPTITEPSPMPTAVLGWFSRSVAQTAAREAEETTSAGARNTRSPGDTTTWKRS